MLAALGHPVEKQEFLSSVGDGGDAGGNGRTLMGTGAHKFGPKPFLLLGPCSLSQNSITDVGACKLAEALPSLAASLLRLR